MKIRELTPRDVPLLGVLFLCVLAWAGPGDAAQVFDRDPVPGDSSRSAHPPYYASNGRGRGQGDPQLRQRYQEWQNLSPSEKEMLRRRNEQWKQMSPQDRRRYQQRYEQWQEMTPDEQQQMHRKLDRWQSLPPDEKERIRNRFNP